MGGEPSWGRALTGHPSCCPIPRDPSVQRPWSASPGHPGEGRKVPCPGDVRVCMKMRDAGAGCSEPREAGDPIPMGLRMCCSSRRSWALAGQDPRLSASCELSSASGLQAGQLPQPPSCVGSLCGSAGSTDPQQSLKGWTVNVGFFLPGHPTAELLPPLPEPLCQHCPARAGRELSAARERAEEKRGKAN